MDHLVASLNDLKKWVKGNLTAYQALEKDVDADQSTAQSLLDQGRAAQQVWFLKLSYNSVTACIYRTRSQGICVE